MNNRECRKEARAILKGKHRQTILFTICFFIFLSIINNVPILGFIVSLPLIFGYVCSVINIANDEKKSYFEFLEIAYDNFAKVWKTNLWFMLKHYPLIAVLVIIALVLITLSITMLNISLMLTGYTVFVITLFVALIVNIKHSVLSFSIKYNDNDSGNEIEKANSRFVKGKKFRIFCMNFYYGLCSFLGVFAFTLLGGMLTGFLGLGMGVIGGNDARPLAGSPNYDAFKMRLDIYNVIFTIIVVVVLVISVLICVHYFVERIIALNEFYKSNNNKDLTSN